MEEYIFKASCGVNSHLFKPIIEIMNSISSTDFLEKEFKKNVKQICFKISSNNLTIFSEQNKRIFSQVVLESKFFETFSYEEEDILCIGLSLDILKTCFKYINKNDQMIITIPKNIFGSFPDTILFSFNEQKGCCMKINLVQNFYTTIFDNINNTLNVDSYRFSNLYREMGGVKKKVNVKYFNNNQENFLRFTSCLVDLAENWVNLNIDNKCQFNKNLNGNFKSEDLKIASKLCLFDNIIQLSIDNDNSIIISGNIYNFKEGNNILGKINLRICSIINNSNI